MSKHSVTARLVISAVATLFVLGFALVIAFSATTVHDSGCRLCHDVDAGRVHAETTCSACHRGTGVAGVVDMRLRMVGMLAATVTWSDLAPESVPNERCLGCHGIVAKEIVVRNGIRVQHADPIEAGISCSACHGSVFHASASKGRAEAGMAECLRCHVASANSADCATCHVDGVGRQTPGATTAFGKTHGKDWRVMHGMGTLSSCATCHTAARCRSCHGTELPHADTWLNSHGGEATGANARCSQCHTASFCDGCHRIPMPHAVSYRASHMKDAKNPRDKRCLRCHDVKSCDACHERHIHPGLPEKQMRELRKKAGLDG